MEFIHIPNHITNPNPILGSAMAALGYGGPTSETRRLETRQLVKLFYTLLRLKGTRRTVNRFGFKSCTERTNAS